MPTLWIVHREPASRIALARLAAAEQSVLGGPADPVFDSAPPADVVVLGLAGDPEPELQFAHRMARRLHRARWVVLAEPARRTEVRRLFDTVDLEILGYPPDASALRACIRQAPARHQPEPLPLSQRPARDVLSARFARSFADLDLPSLMRALDPQLVDVPILIVGERGTGRSLLARYVHAFSDTAGGPLAEVACGPDTSPGDIRAALGVAGREAQAHAAGTVCLYEIHRLPPAVQRRVHGWIEFAPPGDGLHTRLTRWIGTAQDPEALDPPLRQTLSGLCLAIPPLRERPGAVAQVAAAAIEAWCAARGERPRELGEDALAALEEYPWPGNVRELEAVIAQSLSAGSADPIRAGDLRYEGAPFAPSHAGRVDVGLPDEWRPGDPGEIDGAPIEDAFSGPLVSPDEEFLDGADLEDFAEFGEPEVFAEEEAEEEEAITELADEAEPAIPLELPPAPTAPDDRVSLPRLAGAIAHEVRNPLSTIRSFAQLLSERHDDPEFRERFSELVNQDALRIEDVMSRLERLAQLSPPTFEPVDVAALLQRILDDRRASIRERRLVVLQELDTEEPLATGDADQLAFALEALLAKALDLVPAGGDLYIASKHHPTGLAGRPSMRVLLRLRGPEREGAGTGIGRGREPVAGVSTAENALEVAIAEIVVRAHGGALAVDTSDGEETLIVLDLPA